MTSKIVVNNIESSSATNDIKIKSRNVTYTMPTADGTSGQFMKTDGSGNLGFATVDTSVDQTSLKNTVTTPGTTYQSEKLVKVLDYNNNLPPLAAQKFDFVVPTSMFTDDGDATKMYYITRFKLKFKNLCWSYTSDNNTTNSTRLSAYVVPLNASGNPILSSNNNYETELNWYYLDNGNSWNSSNATIGSGNAGTYSRSGGNPTSYPRSTVGQRFVRSNMNLYASNGGLGVNYRLRQGVDKLTRTDSSRMNGFRANLNGELTILNAKNQWDIDFHCTHQENQNRNTGRKNEASSNYQSSMNSSTWYEQNTAPAQGVRLYFLPHEFNDANGGSAGSSGQIEASKWGLAGGIIEFYADISNNFT